MPIAVYLHEATVNLKFSHDVNRIRAMCGGALRQRRFSRRLGCTAVRSDAGDDFFSARRFFYAHCRIAVAADAQRQYR
jgi:hypothetical protein